MMSGDYEPVSLIRGSMRILLSVLAALAVVGVLSLTSILFRSERTAVNDVDLGNSSQLAIRSTNSDLKIVEGSGDRVVIRAKVTDGLSSTTYEIHRQNNEIEIVGRCTRWLSPGCGVSATIEVPKDYPLLVATGSADVHAMGLTDRVVTIGTSSGDVTGDHLRVQELAVVADSGDVSATFEKQPYALKVTTENGDISATIPRGKIKYQTTVRSKTGDVASKLVDAPRGRGLIRLLSDSGDITVRR